MIQDGNDQGMTGREKAMDGLLKELARSGSGADTAFVNRVMARVQCRPGPDSTGNWIQRASRWPGTWMILGVLVAVSLLVISGKPEPKQHPHSEVTAKIEATRDIGTVPAKQDETLLYSATFSLELSEWVDAVSFQVNRRPDLPDGAKNTPSAIANKANGAVLRPVVVSIRDKEINGITIDCKDIKRDAIAGVVLDREFDEDHIEIEFDMRVKEFYRPRNSNWGFFGVGLNRGMNAPPAKHYIRLSKEIELFRHLEQGNWCQYRATLHRSVSKDGVAYTDFQQFYDNVLFSDDRIEMTGSRIVLLQMGICSEITNFRVRRIGPPKANTPDEGF